MVISKITQDAGTNWAESNLTTGRFDLFCESPVSGKLFARGSSSSSSLGVYCSSDKGKHWALTSIDFAISGLGVTSTGRILVTKKDSATNYKVKFYYSDDEGVTWSNYTSEDSDINNIAPIYFHNLTGGRILATGYYGGLLYSDNNGLSWSFAQATGYIPFTYGGKGILVLPSGRILAGFANAQGGNSGGIVYSDDNGTSFQEASIVTTYQYNRNYPMFYKCANGNILAVGSYGPMSMSVDNGLNWEDAPASYSYPNPDNSYCKTSTGRTYTFTGSGQNPHLNYSDDDWVTWSTIQPCPCASDLIYIKSLGRLLSNNTDPNRGIWYSDPEIQTNYTVKPFTGKQAKELVQQCKAYVQSKKQS